MVEDSAIGNQMKQGEEGIDPMRGDARTPDEKREALAAASGLAAYFRPAGAELVPREELEAQDIETETAKAWEVGDQLIDEDGDLCEVQGLDDGPEPRLLAWVVECRCGDGCEGEYYIDSTKAAPYYDEEDREAEDSIPVVETDHPNLRTSSLGYGEINRYQAKPVSVLWEAPVPTLTEGGCYLEIQEPGSIPSNGPDPNPEESLRATLERAGNRLAMRGLEERMGNRLARRRLEDRLRTFARAWENPRLPSYCAKCGAVRSDLLQEHDDQNSLFPFSCCGPVLAFDQAVATVRSGSVFARLMGYIAGVSNGPNPTTGQFRAIGSMALRAGVEPSDLYLPPPEVCEGRPLGMIPGAGPELRHDGERATWIEIRKAIHHWKRAAVEARVEDLGEWWARKFPEELVVEKARIEDDVERQAWRLLRAGGER